MAIMLSITRGTIRSATIAASPAVVALGLGFHAAMAEALLAIGSTQVAVDSPVASAKRDEAARWLRLQPVESAHELRIETSSGFGDSPGEAAFRARTVLPAERSNFRLGLASHALVVRGLGRTDDVLFSAYFEGGFGWTRSEGVSRVMLDDENAFGWSTLGAELFGLCSQTGLGFDGIAHRLSTVASDVSRATSVCVETDSSSAEEGSSLAAALAANAPTTLGSDRGDDSAVTISWNLDPPRTDGGRPTNWYDATVRLRDGRATLERMAVEVWGPRQGQAAGAAPEVLFASSRFACTRWQTVAGRVLPRETEQEIAVRRPDDRFAYSASLARVRAVRECGLDELASLAKELQEPPVGTEVAWLGIGFEGNLGSASFSLGTVMYSGRAPMVALTPRAVWSLLESAVERGADVEVSRPAMKPAADKPRSVPSIERNPARTKDFGTVELVDGRTVLVHEFPLPQFRTRDEVQGIRTTCGCIRAETVETQHGELALRVVLELSEAGPREASVAVLSHGANGAESEVLWFSVRANGRAALQCFPLWAERIGDASWKLHFLVRVERDRMPRALPPSWRALVTRSTVAPLRHWLGTQVISPAEIDPQMRTVAIEGVGPVVLPKGVRVLMGVRE